MCVRLDSFPFTSECTQVLVDPTLRPGWPRNLGRIGAGGFDLAIVDHLTAVDVDGDGALDLPIAYGGSVRVLDADGNDVAGWPQTIDPENSGVLIQFGPAVGDLTGDGRPEVVAMTSRGDVFVWRADGTLLPGWPRRLVHQFGHLAVDDLDGDGQKEIIAISAWISVVDANGIARPGWPRTPDPTFPNFNAPAIGDVDGDGKNEVVVQRATGPSAIYVYRADSTLVPGWPQNLNPGLPTNYVAPSEPVLGDLDGDGAMEIVVGSYDGKVFAFRGDGSQLPGWPQPAMPRPVSTAAIGDIDGDGRPEVVAGTDYLFDSPSGDYLFAWHADGTLVPGWPVRLSDFSHRVFGFGAPSLADVDGDGLTEMAWIARDFNLFVWDLAAPAGGVQPWPMFRRDAGHTGRAPSAPLSNRAPTAAPGGPYTAHRNQAITFNGSGSSDPDGDALTYQWDFGDGATAMGVWPTHAYAGLGSYTVTLVVSDGKVSSPVTTLVTIVNRAPIAQPGGPYAGDNATAATINFNGTGSSDLDGDPLTYHWTFGDGATGSGASPSHTYAGSGSYTVTLTVSDGMVTSVPAATTVTIVDVIAPAAVTDLTTTDVGSNSIALRWTATGDNGSSGTATTYDLRYSTTPIDASNFAAATTIVGEPTPKPAGSTETFTVPNLTLGTTYYFALKVLDAVNNVSGLSNAATATTESFVTLFRDDLEAGAGNWTVAGSDGLGGPALWHPSTHRSASATTSFYYGLEATRNYNTGPRNLGSITSVPISLAGAQGARLSFKYFLQKEPAMSYDLARVFISNDDGATWTPLGDALTSADNLGVAANMSLSAYDGQTIRIRLDFDTVDAIENAYEGWYVDDITVTADRRASQPTPTTTFSDDLESGLSNWTIGGSDGTGGPALWHVGSHRSSSPTRALYYGREPAHTYDTGAHNLGSATSRSISLAGVTAPRLSFRHYLQKEGSTVYDVARVLVSTDGTTWTPLAAYLSTTAMTLVDVDLAAYQNQTIQIRFDFDTVDAYANGYEGWVIDDVRVTGSLAN